MSSRHETPISTSDDAMETRETSSAPSTSILPSAFSRIMGVSSTSSSQPLKRDKCNRPAIVYNKKYDLHKAPPEDLDSKYSPYAIGEPLHDDRPILTARIPRYHIVHISKRPRTQWSWQLGYSLEDTRRTANKAVWACKLCKC
jgi:hypothetical protein